ncbi:hypothetical protein [Chitinophaga pinensis]|nr:hypothetical protein [Chitinophaga pinensis]
MQYTPINNWIPYKLTYRQAEWMVQWLDLSDHAWTCPSLMKLFRPAE